MKQTRKRRILIVDDSEMNREILTGILEDEYDMQVIKKYEEEKRRGKVKTYPIEELFEELDV